MYVSEKRPVFEDARASYELSDATRIGHPQFRAHLEDCFRLRREVKRILRFVVVNPLQAITIIEEHCRSASAVRY